MGDDSGDLDVNAEVTVDYGTGVEQWASVVTAYREDSEGREAEVDAAAGSPPLPVLPLPPPLPPPCWFFRTPVGCRNGVNCQYRH